MNQETFCLGRARGGAAAEDLDCTTLSCKMKFFVVEEHDHRKYHLSCTPGITISFCCGGGTYRDFSNVLPTTQDLANYHSRKRYQEEQNRKETSGSNKNTRADGEEQLHRESPIPQDSRNYDQSHETSYMLMKKGRGNRGMKEQDYPSKNTRFIGFMGTNFPVRLHDLLSKDNCSGAIISWLPHGRSWIVRDEDAFMKNISSHFQFTKYASFVRQVNGWGFKRVAMSSKTEANSYYHEMFLRGMPHLVKQIRKPDTKSRDTPSVISSRKQHIIRNCDLHTISSKCPIIDYFSSSSKHYHKDDKQLSTLLVRGLLGTAIIQPPKQQNSSNDENEKNSLSHLANIANNVAMIKGDKSIKRSHTSSGEADLSLNTQTKKKARIKYKCIYSPEEDKKKQIFPISNRRTKTGEEPSGLLKRLPSSFHPCSSGEMYAATAGKDLPTTAPNTLSHISKYNMNSNVTSRYKMIPSNKNKTTNAEKVLQGCWFPRDESSKLINDSIKVTSIDDSSHYHRNVDTDDDILLHDFVCDLFSKVL